MNTINKIFAAAVIALSLLAPSGIAYAQLATQGGGTGSTSPSGILSGTGAGGLRLQTVKIGTHCTYTANVLDCTGAGGSGSVGTTTPGGDVAGQVAVWGTTGANATALLYSRATSTPTLGGEFTYGGTLGSFVGGTSGSLTLTANGVVLSKLATIGANTILGNNTGSTGNVVAFATSSLGIALSDTTGTLTVARGGTGQVTFTSSQLLYGNGTNALTSVATTTLVAGTNITFSGGTPVVLGGSPITINAAGSGSSFFSSAAGITFANTDPLVGFPTFQATSTTGTSTITNALQIGNTVTGTHLLTVIPNQNYPTSVSTGGAGFLDNTLSTGLGWLFYTNQASPAGRLVEVNCTNTAFSQDCLHIDYNGTQTGFSVTASQPTSKNALSFNAGGTGYALLGSYTGVQGTGVASFSSTVSTTTVFNVVGPTTNQGVVKFTHTATSSDANAAAASFDSATSTFVGTAPTAAAILFLNSTGSTTGNIITGRNNNQDYFDVSSVGVITNAVWQGAPIQNSFLANSSTSFTSGDSSLTVPASIALGASGSFVLNLTHANTWTALQQFNSNASSTLFSNLTKAYFGATATTTIDSTGNIVIPSGSNLTVTGKTDGCATWASGVLNSIGSACGSSSGAAYPFQLSNNGTSTLVNFYGNASSSQLTSTSTTWLSTLITSGAGTMIGTSTTYNRALAVEGGQAGGPFQVQRDGGNVLFGQRYGTNLNILFEATSSRNVASSTGPCIQIGAATTTGVVQNNIFFADLCGIQDGNTNTDFSGSAVIRTYAAGVGADRLVVTSGGFVGINTLTPLAALNIQGNYSASSWTTTGLGTAVGAGIYTDTSSAANTTIAVRAASSYGQPTFAFTTATSTITNAATFYVAGAPTNSPTNSVLTNTSAFFVAAGALTGTTTNSYGLTVNAQTGATNNYAAQFIGGNVGVGSSSPWGRLSVNGQYNDSTPLFVVSTTTLSSGSTTVYQITKNGIASSSLEIISGLHNGFVFADANGSTTASTSIGNNFLTGSGATSFTSGDSSLTVPASIALGASGSFVLNLGHANTWTAQQTFNTVTAIFGVAPTFSTMTAGSVLFAGTAGIVSQDNATFFWNTTTKQLGIGTSTPWGTLSISTTTQSGSLNPLLVIASTTNATLFTVLGGGNVGIGSSTPGSLFAITNASGKGINLGTGTSTFTGLGGINLVTGAGTAGCFAINGTCVGGSGSGTVGSGTTGQFPYYAANGTTLTATSSLYLSAAGQIGIGTTSPLALLTVQQTHVGEDLFKALIATTTAATTTMLTSGTYTVPAGVTVLKVYAWGGGGGSGGGAGGAGAYVASTSYAVTGGQVLTITIGQGGGFGACGSVAGAGGTGYHTGGSGAVLNSCGGAGGGGSTLAGTIVAAGGGGGNGITTGTAATSASGTTGGNGGSGTGGGGNGGGGGGAANTDGTGASGGSGGAGGTGATTATGTNGQPTGTGAGNYGGASAAGFSGNGNNNSGSTGGNGSGGATPGNNGTLADSGGGGQGNSATANGGVPAAGGGGGGAANGNGGAGEVILVLPSATVQVLTVMRIDSDGHLMTGGDSPTCGTGCTGVTGDDNTFRVTTGSSVSSATVNFATVWMTSTGVIVTPVCLANEESAGVVATNASSTPTGVVIEFASAVTSVKVSVSCKASDNFNN